MASSLSPFCAETTHPVGVRWGNNAWAATSVWCALVARMMLSHWPRTVSGVNAGARVVNVSIGPEIVRPERLMEATCSDTVSTKVTSWPARARNAPSVPPIAPAPHTRLQTGPPGSIQQGARFLDCDLPQRENFGVGALVAAAE